MQVKYPRHSMLSFYTILLISLLFVKEIFNGTSAEQDIGSPILYFYIYIFVYFISVLHGKSFTKIRF